MHHPNGVVDEQAQGVTIADYELLFNISCVGIKPRGEMSTLHAHPTSDALDVTRLDRPAQTTSTAKKECILGCSRVLETFTKKMIWLNVKKPVMSRNFYFPSFPILFQRILYHLVELFHPSYGHLYYTHYFIRR
jgi:hypothetical protein